MEKVKLGFVGCGMMGQLAHLANFVELPQCEVIALAEVRKRLGEQVAEKYRIPKLYHSHEELIEDNEVEAVVEITGDDFHAPLSIDLLNAGKHVLIEKPLTTNVADGEAMVKAAEKGHAILMVSYMKRYDPGVELAKQVIDELRESKGLGEITFVRSHCFGGDWVCNIGKSITTDEPYPQRAKTFPKWLPEEMADQFRGFNNVFCHNIDLLRYLLGEVKEVEITHLKTRPSGSVIVLGFDGFSASLETGSLSAGFWDEETKIYFRDGWVEVKTPPPLLRNVPAQVEVYRAGQHQEVLSLRAAWEWAFRRADEHFLECVVEKKEPRSSGKDALEDLRVVEKIFKKYLQIA